MPAFEARGLLVPTTRLYQFLCSSPSPGLCLPFRPRSPLPASAFDRISHLSLGTVSPATALECHARPQQQALVPCAANTRSSRPPRWPRLKPARSRMVVRWPARSALVSRTFWPSHDISVRKRVVVQWCSPMNTIFFEYFGEAKKGARWEKGGIRCHRERTSATAT